MKHLSQIQIEFIKNADWEDRSRGYQREYLKKHPKTRLRLTAPKSDMCTHCGHPLNVKDHGDWEGYHCPHCGQGGSRSKNRPNRFHQHQFPHKKPSEINKDLELSDAIKNLTEPTIDIKPGFYNAATKTFSFELSDVDMGGASRTVNLRNPKTGVVEKFMQYKVDKDATDEDIYGWHYKSQNGKYELLIIND